MIHIVVPILLSIVEGITEFLPISSTGHMILVSDWLAYHPPFIESFEIAVQLGAIASVLWLYKYVFTRYLNPKNWLSTDFQAIVIATLPVLIVGFLGYSLIKSWFLPHIVAASLIVGGVVMMVVEKLTLNPTTVSLSEISKRQALKIGLAQCVALIPGTSRSAATMIGGLLTGCNYETSAQFSFIIAVPVMMAATGLDLIKSAHLYSSQEWMIIGLGMGISFITAYITMKALIKWINTIKLMPFALYRIALGLVILWVI